MTDPDRGWERPIAHALPYPSRSRSKDGYCLTLPTPSIDEIEEGAGG